jgi:hypothetical protein
VGILARPSSSSPPCGSDRLVAHHVLDVDLPPAAGLPPSASRFKTPWLSLICFSGLLATATLLPGRSIPGDDVLIRTMLSFAVANAALIGLLPVPRRRAASEVVAAPSSTWSRLAHICDRRPLRDQIAAWITVVVEEPTTRWVGFGWLAAGFTAYVLCVSRSPCAPPSADGTRSDPGGASVSRYRRIVVRWSTGTSRSLRSTLHSNDAARHRDCSGNDGSPTRPTPSTPSSRTGKRSEHPAR